VINLEELRREILEGLETKGEWIGKIPLEWIRGVSPYNARKHRIEENIQELENSIGLTGEVRNSLTLNQDFQVVQGQRRYIIAKKWNFKEVPVIIRKYEDRLLELVDSRNENQLTYPLCSEDEEDVVCTLVKAWGESKTAQILGKSIASISNIVRFREAPEAVQETLKDASSRIKAKLLAVLTDICEKKGPEEAIKVGKIVSQYKDLDVDQYVKDYWKREPIDIYERLKRGKKEKPKERRIKRKEEQYSLLTLRLPKKISYGLSQLAKKFNKDKLDLILEVLERFIEEHKGLLKV